MPHERVQLGDRVCDLGADTRVGLVRSRYLSHDALRREMFEEPLTPIEPPQMCAKARDDPRSTLSDLPSQIGPQRPRPRRPKDVTRAPGVSGVVVRIRWKRLALSGQPRELARIA